MAQTKTKRTEKNAPLCKHCDIRHESRFRSDHKMKEKHRSYCSHCDQPGHHMSLCYKLKFCNLCGKAGHNPYRCWEYSTMRQWRSRARELDRCVNCLRPWKLSEPNIMTETRGISLTTYCSHCLNHRYKVWPQCNEKPCCDDCPPQRPKVTKEIQTQENSYTVQECQTEPEEGKSIIESQRVQIEEMKSTILSLENKLENSNVTIDSLEWKLKSITKEKEQELQKVNKLDSLCKEKEMELRNCRN